MSIHIKGKLKKEANQYKRLLLNEIDWEKGERNWKYLLGILLVAFVLRITLLFFPEVIHNDGIAYITHAKRIINGDWSIGKGDTHPLYPFLIAVTHFFIPNIELAGIGVSIFLGSLLLIPLFYFTSNLFNERVGFLSILFASFHPYLYIYSGSVLTESTFYFLFVTSSLFGWKVFEKGRFQDIFLFSFFVSLGYLTRIESIGFLFLFSFWVLFIPSSFEERSWIKRLSFVFMAISLFLIFSSPYLIQIKKETGKWQISQKISISIGSLSEEDNEEAILKIKQNKSIKISSFINSPLILAKLIMERGIQSLYKFYQVFTPYLFIIALIGIFIGKSKLSSVKGNLYILSFFLYLILFIHPLFRPGRRYATHVIPIALPWAAFGFLQIIDWIRKKIKSEEIQKKIFVFLLMVLLLTLFVQGRVIHRREHRIIQKEAGLWMREHLSKGKVMSRLPQEAFYGEMEWIKIPSGGFNEVLSEAYSKGVQYLIIDQEIIKQYPDFLEEMINFKGWELLNLFKRDNRWIKIFRLNY